MPINRRDVPFGGGRYPRREHLPHLQRHLGKHPDLHPRQYFYSYVYHHRARLDFNPCDVQVDLQFFTQGYLRQSRADVQPCLGCHQECQPIRDMQRYLDWHSPLYPRPPQRGYRLRHPDILLATRGYLVRFTPLFERARSMADWIYSTATKSRLTSRSCRETSSMTTPL